MQSENILKIIFLKYYGHVDLWVTRQFYRLYYNWKFKLNFSFIIKHHYFTCDMAIWKGAFVYYQHIMFSVVIVQPPFIVIFNVGLAADSSEENPEIDWPSIYPKTVILSKRSFNGRLSSVGVVLYISFILQQRNRYEIQIIEK